MHLYVHVLLIYCPFIAKSASSRLLFPHSLQAAAFCKCMEVSHGVDCETQPKPNLAPARLDGPELGCLWSLLVETFFEGNQLFKSS